jgi:transcriptional regulator with XRE-family HTH domain
MTIGQKIAEARKEKGLSGADLSRRSLISGAYLSDIESGKRSPSVETLRRLEEALGLDLSTDDIRLLWDRLQERCEEHPSLFELLHKIANGQGLELPPESGAWVKMPFPIPSLPSEPSPPVEPVWLEEEAPEVTFVREDD